MYLKSRTKRKPETKIQGNSVVWNSRGSTDILSSILESTGIYELTSPGLTMISRKLFWYIIVHYNSRIELFLIHGLNVQLHSVIKFTALVIWTVVGSSILILKYKILLGRLNPIFSGSGLSLALVFGGIKICGIKYSDLYYPKQAE